MKPGYVILITVAAVFMSLHAYHNGLEGGKIIGFKEGQETERLEHGWKYEEDEEAREALYYKDGYREGFEDGQDTGKSKGYDLAVDDFGSNTPLKHRPTPRCYK